MSDRLLTQDEIDEVDRLRRMTPEQRRRTAAMAALAEIDREAGFYEQYIQSPEWRARAEAAKARVGYRCQVCYSNSLIEAHHRTWWLRPEPEWEYEQFHSVLLEPGVAVIEVPAHPAFSEFLPDWIVATEGVQ